MKQQLIESAQKYMYKLDQFPTEAVRSQIEDELNEILEFNNETVLENRLDYIGIGRKEDYLNRLIETSEGFVLAGIRHLGGNREEPFVYMWPGFKIKDLEKVISEISPYFKMFKPKAYHFWTRPDCNDYNVSIMQQRFIARTDDLVKYHLELYKPTDYYEWYRKQYELFHEFRPDFVNRVKVNPKDLMDNCLEQGMLYQLKEGSEIVGLIAGEKVKFLGNTTVYIDELLISEDFRGKGYATKLLGSFVNLLDVKYLTCYIDHENTASRKTALRAGEVVFSQECSVVVG